MMMNVPIMSKWEGVKLQFIAKTMLLQNKVKIDS